MDIGRILNTHLNVSHPSEASADNSASNPPPVAEIASASTPSINVHETTAMIDGPVPELDATAQGALPYQGFDDMYDDERRPPPEVNAGPDNGLPTPPPYRGNRRRNEPPNAEPSPRTILPPISQLIGTSPAAPNSGVRVHGTTAASSSGARRIVLPWLERIPTLSSRPIDKTTSASSSRRPDLAARYSNGIPDVAEIIDVDASVTQPNTAARSSNRIPDDAGIMDVDAWEARRRTQVTPPPSDLSVQVGSTAPVSPVQASSCTLSESELERIAVDFLASNYHSRDILQGPSGAGTGGNATPKDDNPSPGQETRPWFHLDIETARESGDEDLLGAALLWALIPSIDNNSSVECESCDEECESCDEAAANMEYIYIPRARQQTRHGNELETIRAHPGNAVWALEESRLGPVNDPRKWERACSRCNPCFEERREEQREQTIPLEEAAVDDKNNGMTGAATYNPDLYTTTSSMRELRVKPSPPKAEPEDMALSSNLSSPPPPDQAPSSSSNAKGKQKANGDGNSTQSQPTPPLASARATSSRPIGRSTREANGNINSNASGTQARSPPPPPPPSPTRTSLRNRRLFALEPQLPSLPPAPVVASSSYRSQRYAPSPLGQTFDRSNATTPEQVQTFSNNKTKEANNDDAEQRRAGGKKEKKNVSWDCKENGKANNKRKASEAVEDVDAGCIRVTRARRNIVSNSSNVFYMSGALQDSQSSAASGTLAAGSGTSSNLTVPNGLAGHAPNPVAHSAPPTTAARSEGSSERRVRLRLRVSAEANPEHPDHKTYLTARAMSRKRGKE